MKNRKMAILTIVLIIALIVIITSCYNELDNIENSKGQIYQLIINNAVANINTTFEMDELTKNFDSDILLNILNYIIHKNKSIFSSSFTKKLIIENNKKETEVISIYLSGNKNINFSKNTNYWLTNIFFDEISQLH